MTSIQLLPPAQPAKNINQTEQKIRGFGKLAEGWHFGEGVRPSSDFINRALRLHSDALAMGYAETDAFPGVSGEIRVTIYRGRTYLEFTFEADGSVTFVHEDGGVEIEYTEHLTQHQAFQRLLKTQMRLWATSESYTRDTMIAGRHDSKVLRSKIPPTVVSLSSTKNVHFKKADPFARMFASFTQPRLAIPRFSGTFLVRHYLQTLGSTLTSAQAGIHVTET